MRNYRLALPLLLFLSTGMDVEISTPEEVQVTSYGGTFNAEILSVRESTLVLVSPAGKDEHDLMRNEALIRIVRNDEIYSIKTSGSSHVLVGSLVGCLAGCITGGAIGRQKDKEEEEEEERRARSQGDWALSCNPHFNGLGYAVALGAGGAVLGAAIGSAASAKDSLWIKPGHRDFSALKALSRYPHGEPAFLREIE